MSRTVFYKEGDEYVKAGAEFQGFPSDGVWLVKDGKANYLVRLSDVPDPISLARLEQHRRDLELKAMSLLVRWRQGEEMSPSKIVDDLFDIMKRTLSVET